jgi:hypothetical protein
MARRKWCCGLWVPCWTIGTARFGTPSLARAVSSQLRRCTRVNALVVSRCGVCCCFVPVSFLPCRNRGVGRGALSGNHPQHRSSWYLFVLCSYNTHALYNTRSILTCCAPHTSRGSGLGSSLGGSKSTIVTVPRLEHRYRRVAVRAMRRTPSDGPFTTHICERLRRSQPATLPSEQPANSTVPTTMTHHTCRLLDTRSSYRHLPWRHQHRTEPSEEPVYSTSPMTCSVHTGPLWPVSTNWQLCFPSASRSQILPVSRVEQAQAKGGVHVTDVAIAVATLWTQTSAARCTGELAQAGRRTGRARDKQIGRSGVHENEQRHTTSQCLARVAT